MTLDRRVSPLFPKGAGEKFSYQDADTSYCSGHGSQTNVYLFMVILPLPIWCRMKLEG